jgi:hypothetical protein
MDVQNAEEQLTPDEQAQIEAEVKAAIQAAKDRGVRWE